MPRAKWRKTKHSGLHSHHYAHVLGTEEGRPESAPRGGVRQACSGWEL